ncbi:MAG: MTH865 family protein [Methanomassiliicoccales archaeon]
MVDVKKEIRKQIVGALKGAKFPLKTPEELLGAFPMGAETTCQAGDVKMTAGEAGKLLKKTDFPFKTAEQVADTILNRAGI